MQIYQIFKNSVSFGLIPDSCISSKGLDSDASGPNAGLSYLSLGF